MNIAATPLARDPIGTVRATLCGAREPRIVDLATLAGLQCEAGQTADAAGTFAELSACDPVRRDAWARLRR